MRTKYFLAAIGLMALVAAPAFGQDDTARTEQVEFAPDTSGASITDKITGSQSVTYLLTANADEILTVSLETDNAGNTFTITAPAAKSAMFTGSDNANRFEGSLPASGEYAIHVFLIPRAADAGEAANYTITVVTSGVAD
jgi:hypothetical protein